MSDATPITPLVRRKVHDLLRNKALTLLGPRTTSLTPTMPSYLPSPTNFSDNFDHLGYDWHNDTQHVAMRQKQWAVIFRQWPTPPIDFATRLSPHNLQVVPNKGSAHLIAQRKRAAGIHPSKPAYTPPTPPSPASTSPTEASRSQSSQI